MEGNSQHFPYLLPRTVWLIRPVKCFTTIQVPCGVVANISRFHRDAPGSIPGEGAFFSYLLPLTFLLPV